MQIVGFPMGRLNYVKNIGIMNAAVRICQVHKCYSVRLQNCNKRSLKGHVQNEPLNSVKIINTRALEVLLLSRHRTAGIEQCVSTSGTA